MPTYHYACASCANEFDQYQTFAEDSLTDCPACDGRIRRVIQPVGIVFKGSGWYLTDSRQPEGKADDKSESKDVGKASGKETTADMSTESKVADSSKSETPAKPDSTKKAEKAPSTKSVESKTTPATRH